MKEIEKIGRNEKRFYGIWGNMLQRCNNSKNTAYKYYGARGIRVCDDWKEFSNFKAKYGLRGVKKRYNKWEAQIFHNNKFYYLGLFKTVEEAADAYDKKARALWGEFAYQNNYGK